MGRGCEGGTLLWVDRQHGEKPWGWETETVFLPRKPKSTWSKVNKDHIKELEADGLLHRSGLEAIALAKANGSWTELDDVENGVVPQDLQKAFSKNKRAFTNFQSFTPGQQKSYLYWLNQAKREETREKRIQEIVELSAKNIKYRNQ